LLNVCDIKTVRAILTVAEADIYKYTLGVPHHIFDAF